MNQKLLNAQAFGTHLDADEFEPIKHFIAIECTYDLGEKILIGPEQISSMYEENMLDGRKKFDELIWGTSVVKKINEDVYDVHFSDFLKHKGFSHNYSCIQRLHFNGESLIIRIEHIELPGQKESLEEFKSKVL